jgi:hypothetical protein
MIYVYILLCENNKYYVGKTEHLHQRIKDHFDGIGSEWTRQYQPLKVWDIIPNCDEFDEGKYTRKYMSVYGIDNVRGDIFCQIELFKSEKEYLLKEIRSSKNQCYKCGKNNHFAKRCPSNNLSNISNPSKKPRINYNNVKKCDRCGRNNHNKDKCYAKTDVNKNYLSDSSDEWDDSFW